MIAVSYTHLVEGTYLEDLDEVTIRSDFRQLATDSVYYLLSRRCGLDPMELLEEEDLSLIHIYNSLMLYALMTSKPDEVEKRKKLGIGERDD